MHSYMNEQILANQEVLYYDKYCSNISGYFSQLSVNVNVMYRFHFQQELAKILFL